MMVVWCASGCVVRGQHVESCQDPECPGCQPREAVEGVLCRWCFQRLTGAVVDIPGLVAHLREMAAPGVVSALGREGGGAGVPGSRSLYPPALETADELIGMLGSWVDEIVEEHPDHLQGPPARGWRFSRPAWRHDPDTGEVWRPEVERTFATQRAVEDTVRWLLPRLGWVAGQPWAPDMRRELCAQVSTALARWPMEEREHDVPAPCPWCEQWALRYHPPEEFGAPERVTCENPDCARTWSGSEWEQMSERMVERSKPGWWEAEDASA